ncbi:MAG: hypothetical protein K6E56_04120, partial [Lachnospiraceae bacterium]|nr:hypothetical protein [Lachnospiraceae bacterium]
MKIVKRVISIVLTVALSISLAQVSAFAATGTDVTASMKSDKGIDSISSIVSMYIGYIDEGYTDTKTSGKITLDTKTKYNMAIYYMPFADGLDWYSNSEYGFPVKEKVFKKTFKNLFGTNAKPATDDTKGVSKVVNGKVYCTVSGEWGDVCPQYKIVKVTKYSDTKYKVVLKTGWEDYSEDDSLYYNGKAVLTLKKSAKSDY